MAQRIKKGDTVEVIAGRDKGSRGEVLKVLADGRAVVENVNLIKRHQKPTTREPQGGIIEREAAIHLSNLMPVDSKTDKPTRVKSGQDKDGNKIRVAVRSDAPLEG